MKRGLWYSLVLVLACGPIGFADEPKEDPKDDKKVLEGTWSVVALTDNGMEHQTDTLKSLKIVITEDTFTLKGPKGEHSAKYKADPAAKPNATFDLTPTDGKFKDKVCKGIFKFGKDKDELEIALNKSDAGDHPAEFAAGSSSDRSLIRLKREKP